MNPDSSADCFKGVRSYCRHLRHIQRLVGAKLGDSRTIPSWVCRVLLQQGINLCTNTADRRHAPLLQGYSSARLRARSHSVPVASARPTNRPRSDTSQFSKLHWRPHPRNCSSRRVSDNKSTARHQVQLLMIMLSRELFFVLPMVQRSVKHCQKQYPNTTGSTSRRRQQGTNHHHHAFHLVLPQHRCSRVQVALSLY